MSNSAPNWFSLADLLLVIFSVGVGLILGLLFGYTKGWNACFDRWFADEEEVNDAV